MKKPVTLKSIFLAAVLLLFGAVAFAERLSVSAPVANVRNGPGSNFDIIWKVGQYHPLQIIQKKGEWYQFRDFENDTGWIHRSLLGSTASVITNRNTCNVRSGPGTGHEILFTVDIGVPFKVIKIEGRWIHIEHADGDQGWIHDSLVW